MIQKTLFDTPAKPPKLARSSDPETSHEAAKKAEATRTETVDRCVEILRRASNPMTADEVALKAVGDFFPHLRRFEAEYITALSNHRKRAHELHNKYGLAEIVEGRKRNAARLMRLKEQSCKN